MHVPFYISNLERSGTTQEIARGVLSHDDAFLGS